MSHADQENQGVLTRAVAWARHPFTSDMSAGGWLLFLGLIVCGCVAWTRLLDHIEE